MRKLSIAIALIALVALVPAASAINNPFVPDPPKTGHAAYTWVHYGCKNGRAYGSIKTWVRKLSSKYGQYRQKVKVQLDKQVGFNAARPDWRQVAARTTEGAWFQKDGNVPSNSVPNELRSGLNTGFQLAGDLTIKVTVWLKQGGLPNSKWRYRVRSPEFQCDLGGALPPPGGAPPSSGGGDS